MPYAKKTDANQREIVKLFRQLGCRVYVSSGFGDGFPDLVVQHKRPERHRSETLLVEVKDGSLPPSKRCLTAIQEEFHEIFECHIVTCKDDVFKLLNILSD
jgi:hypothetical protein